MKEIKKILVLALILIFFIGCGSSPSGSSSSTVQNNNQSDDIAYFAYTSNYDHQNDMVLKTDGTLNNTSLVSNSLMSTNSNQEIGLYDFKIFS
ncbi:MAG: hypothetical protein HRT40_12305, partial [Campylobacteraceae bacterium]|nr:hypothetical protein [Campylobacteraceae bacterium]